MEVHALQGLLIRQLFDCSKYTYNYDGEIISTQHTIYTNLKCFSSLQVYAQQNLGSGIQREIFFLNLEDGYFGCQVNESTEVLQLFEISKLCDGSPNCFLGSDENIQELKCTSKL